MTRIGSILALSLSCLCSQAVGADRGIYIGVQLGYASADGVADTDVQTIYSPEPLELAPGLALPRLEATGFDEAFFDDSDTAWGFFLGFRISQYFGIELAFNDLGTYKPTNRPSQSAMQYESASLEVWEYSASAKLQYPITTAFSANGWLGVSRNSFNADGTAGEVISIVGLPVIGFLGGFAPVVDPGNETGYLWGVGVDYSISEKFSLGLNLIRHDTQVIEVDTINLSVSYSL